MATDDVSEDALYEALVNAAGCEDFGCRALLEAARWFREHEWAGDDEWETTGFCIECKEYATRTDRRFKNPERPGRHDPTCTVGRWVRAAERAGL